MTAASLLRPRRGALAVAATLAVAAAVPGAADAATVKGTVVAKDANRGTVVTAARGGAVKTLRAAHAKRYRIGQRIVARASAQPDGTFAASGKVKRLRGKARTARVRATVVRRAGGRYLVSAGSSTFAIGKRASAAAAGSAAAPQAGDIIDAKLRLAGGRATGQRLRTVGEASMLEIEGIFVDAGAGVLRIAVERRGLVTVTVPEGTAVSATAGDEVEAIVSVEDDGSFALVALRTDDDDEGDDHGFEFDFEDGVVEVAGTITELADASVTLSAGPDATVTCGAPAGTSLAGFSVGDEVEAECRLGEDGAFQLVALESEAHEVEVDDDGEVEDEGDDDKTRHGESDDDSDDDSSESDDDK
jgi:hypothetical protein